MTNPSQPGRVPAPAADVCVAYLDGEAVLYDVRACRPVLLNATAAAVWAEIDGVRTGDAIAAELAQRFAADPAQVGADVAATLEELRHLQMLV